jgi:hypothetical protein
MIVLTLWHMLNRKKECPPFAGKYVDGWYFVSHVEFEFGLRQQKHAEHI